MILPGCLRRTGRAGNKGYAYTFLTSDQKRYAGHIIKALELSATPVPDELNEMWNDYVKEMELVGFFIDFANYSMCLLRIYSQQHDCNVMLTDVFENSRVARK